MTTTLRGIRSAFTLIELLVVIAIIALLVGILLPALSEARCAAQGAVSASNVRQLTTVIHTYASEQRDSFPNPFQTPPELASWFDVVVQSRLPTGQVWIWRFDDPGYQSEMYSAHWASLMANYIDEGQLRSKICFAPGDKAVLLRFDQNLATTDLNEFLWDGSYWLSPTLWMKSSRYDGTLRVPVQANGTQWARNRIDQVVSPQAKVAVWERFTFCRKSRPTGQAGQGRSPLLPMWNNPEAQPWIGLVDGSADRPKMAQLHRLAATTSPPEQQAQFRPSGNWAIPDTILGDPTDLFSYGLKNDGLENGANGTTAWPAFFWATRGGIKGRDLPR